MEQIRRIMRPTDVPDTGQLSSSLSASFFFFFISLSLHLLFLSLSLFFSLSLMVQCTALVTSAPLLSSPLSLCLSVSVMLPSSPMLCYAINIAVCSAHLFSFHLVLSYWYICLFWCAHPLLFFLTVAFIFSLALTLTLTHSLTHSLTLINPSPLLLSSSLSSPLSWFL